MKKIYFFVIFTYIGLLSAGHALGLEISPRATGAGGGIGQAVEVAIDISDVAAGLSLDAFSMTVSFDETVLGFDEAAGLDKTGTYLENLSLLSARIMSPGQIKINGAMFGSQISITQNGLFLKMLFSVNSVENTQISLGDFLDDIANAATNPANISISPNMPEPPGGIEARSGIDSVRVSWEPASGAYLAGYNVYRSASLNGTYAKLNTETVTGDFYIDDLNLSQGSTYYYYIRSVDTSGQESEPSEKISAVFGTVKFFIPDSNGKTTSTVRLPVNINNADGLQMCSTAIYVTYDDSILTATGIERTPLTENYAWAQNLNTPGVVRAAIADIQGETLYGEGALFYILFDVKGSAGQVSNLTFQIDTTYFYDCRDDYNEVPS
ncbi:MAG: cohesin domain-containing protein, partial [Desulfococcaceae bacterium]|nr:cohesin domain-containing protein [Desulfococcaceae bacterium]